MPLPGDGPPRNVQLFLPLFFPVDQSTVISVPLVHLHVALPGRVEGHVGSRTRRLPFWTAISNVGQAERGNGLVSQLVEGLGRLLQSPGQLDRLLNRLQAFEALPGSAAVAPRPRLGDLGREQLLQRDAFRLAPVAQLLLQAQGERRGTHGHDQQEQQDGGRQAGHPGIAAAPAPGLLGRGGAAHGWGDRPGNGAGPRPAPRPSRSAPWGP